MIWGCTGHRPERVGGYDAASLTVLVRTALDWLDTARPTRVISGMALGWDQAVAMACIETGVPLVAAIPYRGHGANWPARSYELYKRMLEKASDVKHVSERSFFEGALQARNRWIVNQCEHLVALWDGEKRGGTWNCLDYAASVGRPVTNLWERWVAHAGGSS